MFCGEETLERAGDSRGFTLIEQKQLQELTTEGTESTEETLSFKLGGERALSARHGGIGSFVTTYVAQGPQGVLKAKHA